ncbi:ABC transporter permease [Streptomyces sp. NPDC088789]|uniref:ABC transporter permease n=1 Tax=Streptomyces sp. NPDC088789 TaxID=3365899 RepID=UPI0038289E54
MLTHAVAGRFSAHRSAAVVRRNARAMQTGPSAWLLVLAGLVEPLFYLLSIGLGVGSLIAKDIAYQGHRIPYADFVAPAMLATSAMTAAFSTVTFAFFAKLRQSKVYEAVLVTPVTPAEVAVAEVVWSALRGAVYCGLFLVTMVLLGTVTPGWALLALLASVLAVIAFAALGLAASTLMRGWHDFDALTTAQMALFLFSGTFSPVQDYPGAAQILVELTPLYHAVELLRRICVGDPGPHLLWHVGYLLAITGLCLTFAARRIHALVHD